MPKISELPALVTPLVGFDIFPIVDGGVTKKANFVDVATYLSTVLTPTLNGDVTGPTNSNTVALVGGQTAADVAAGVILANNATNTIFPIKDEIVRRDANGDFQANNIESSLRLIPATGGFALQTDNLTQQVEESAVTNNELSYLSGVTGSIQDQFTRLGSGYATFNVSGSPVAVTNPCPNHIIVTGTGGSTLTLPEMDIANSLNAFKNTFILIKSNASGTFVVNDFSGNPVIPLVPLNSLYLVMVRDNGSPGGQLIAYNISSPSGTLGTMAFQDADAVAITGGGANLGTNTPLPSALAFNITSTTKGSRPAPEMTTAQRTALTPVNSEQVYDTTLQQLMMYNATTVSWSIVA